jgi:hypothetical protein
MSKQTAAEWYAIEVVNYLKDIYGEGIVNLDLLSKAKEMEKQQTIDFTFNYFLDNQNGEDIEQYYNETYKP